MALRFRTLLPFAIPGVLALIGWWWFSSRRKERASHRTRRDLAALEGCGVGSPKEKPGSSEDVPSSHKLSLPLEAEQPAEATLTSGPLAGLGLPPPGTRSPDPSRGLPVVANNAMGCNTLQDDSEEPEAMVSESALWFPTQVSAMVDAQRDDPCAVDSALEEKPDSSLVVDHVVSVEASPLALPPLEQSEGSTDVSVRNDSVEKPLRETQGLAVLDGGSLPSPCCEVLDEAILETPVSAEETEELSISGGAADQVDQQVGLLTANEFMESASSGLSREEERSASDLGSVLTCHGVGDVGHKSSLERERTGGVNLDRGVETIEEVAIQIISRVILAATEEVLAGSVGEVSGRICQVASSHADTPLEGVSVGALGQAEPSVGVDQVAMGDSAVLEQNVNLPTRYASHLVHGLLANPSCGLSGGSVCAKQPDGDLTMVASLEEAFEDARTTTEDSGCSACTSEDGASAEDLLKHTLSPPSGRRLDLLASDKDSKHNSSPSKMPPSPTLPENKVPYSNGVLREDCPDLRHDQPWPADADADHSGGSDVNSMDSVDSGCALRKNDGCQNSKTGVESNKMELIIWEIEVPKHLVGRLIGKQGRYVSFLKQTSGAKIYISTLPYTQDFQICHIEGSQQNVDKALNLIGKKFKDLSLTNIYAPPPPPLPLHSLPMTSWLMLPDGVTVEVIVVNQVNAGHLFVQQHTHPTFHVLRSLDQQMYLCYSQPGIPTMPTPVEVGVVCAAPGVEGAWWRAQVVGYFKDTSEVEIRYVDYGGYERVKIDTLRQIRSDFVTLPFQGAEVLLDNVVPLPDEDRFSSEADAAVSEMTRGTPLLAQVTNYDGPTGMPLIQLWSMLGDELVSINRTLVERGFAQWVESY